MSLEFGLNCVVVVSPSLSLSRSLSTPTSSTFLLLTLLSSLFLPLALFASVQQQQQQKKGWNGIPTSECQSKGCCFSRAPASQGELALRLPSCFRPNGGDSAYSVSASPAPGSSPATNGPGPGEARATLSQTASTAPGLGPDSKDLDLSLTLPARDVARLTMGAPKRWSVPASVLPGVSGVERRGKELDSSSSRANGEGGSALEVEVVSSPSFAAVVTRRSENSSSSPSSSPLLDTRGFRLVFKEQYIELTTRLPSSGRGALYGLGERTSSSELLPLRRNGDGVPFTLWARDAAAADADQNSYG